MKSIVFNQRGNISLLGFTFTILITTLMCISLLNSLNYLDDLKKKHKFILCLKEYTELTKQSVRRINTLNLAIKTGEYSKYASAIIGIFFPPAFATTKALNKAEKAAKRFQELIHQKYYLELKRLTYQCKKLFTSPYHHQFGIIKRQSGIAKLEKTKWKSTHYFQLRKFSLEFTSKGSFKSLKRVRLLSSKTNKVLSILN